MKEENRLFSNKIKTVNNKSLIIVIIIILCIIAGIIISKNVLTPNSDKQNNDYVNNTDDITDTEKDNSIETENNNQNNTNNDDTKNKQNNDYVNNTSDITNTKKDNSIETENNNQSNTNNDNTNNNQNNDQSNINTDNTNNNQNSNNTNTNSESNTDSRIKNGELNLYVSTTGNDQNDGTKNKPVKTLSKAYSLHYNILKTNKADVVRIHIASGNYTNQFLKWNWCAENSTVRIYGDSDNIPVFSGSDDKGFFMTLNNMNNCKYIVYNIKVQNYENGIKIYSNNNNNEGNNIIDNVHFYKIGDYYVGSLGVAGVDLMYSNNNIVRNCSFDHLLNKEDTGSHIHGVYVAYGSSNNRIFKNTFSNIKPDPIRFRDGSNNNKVTQNTFTRAGLYAYCSEWYSATKNEKKSEGNLFYNNILNNGYNDSQIDETAIFEPDTAKKIQPDSSRLKSYGNTKK